MRDSTPCSWSTVIFYHILSNPTHQISSTLSYGAGIYLSISAIVALPRCEKGTLDQFMEKDKSYRPPGRHIITPTWFVIFFLHAENSSGR